MKCESTLTYELDDAKTAAWFASSLQDPKTAGKSAEDEEIDEDAAERATVSVKASGKTVTCTVTAKDAAALRARTTTLLRDVKVVLDILHVTSNAKGK